MRRRGVVRRTARRWRLVRARTDAVPASVRRFNQRARRRRLRAAAPWIGAAGVLALAGLLGWVLYATPVLGVDRVLIQGVDIAGPDEVRAAAAVAPGTPMARVDLAAVARRVEALPPVRHARVLRDWPHTIVIDVTERSAAAAVPGAGGFGLIDRSGVLFEEVPALPAGVPVVKVATPGPDDPSTRAALRVLAALTPPLRDRLRALVADAPTRIRLELTGGRTVVWGDDTENPDKARVATDWLAMPGTAIDVSAPGVVTMR